MHVARIKLATDIEHDSHCITEYFGRPIRGDPLDEQQQMSIYIAYNKHSIHNYKHENNLYITLISDYNADNVNYSPFMIIAPQSAGHGWHTMCLSGEILGIGVLILVDTGATHNIIDLSFVNLINPQEQHLDTTILLDISNDIDIILGTPC